MALGRVGRSRATKAHEVVEVVELVGGLTREFELPTVWAAEKRGVDPGVVGRPDVGLVVADEQRGRRPEVRQRPLQVIRGRFLPREAGDRRLAAVHGVEPVRQPEVCEEVVDGRLLVRGDDAERRVEPIQRLDVVVWGLFSLACGV